MYICIFTRFDCQAGDLGVGPHAKDFISRPGILQIPLCAQLNEYGTDRRAAAIDHSCHRPFRHHSGRCHSVNSATCAYTWVSCTLLLAFSLLLRIS